MHGRDGDRIADSCRNGFDVFAAELLEAVQMGQEPSLAVGKGNRMGRIFQIFDERIDLRRLDAGQVIADGHIELHPVRAP